jgi:hypothetical protein
MFSLSKVFTMMTLCAAMTDYLDSAPAVIVVNIIMLPVAFGLQLLRNYTGRSRRLAPVGYLATGFIVMLTLVLMIIEGIQLEPHAPTLEHWGSMTVWALLWEIIIFDTIRAVLILVVYR